MIFFNIKAYVTEPQRFILFFTCLIFGWNAAAAENPVLEAIEAGIDFTIPLELGRRQTPLDMVYVKKGKFIYGPIPTAERPRHPSRERQIELTESFWIGRYEITQAQWKKIMGDEKTLEANYREELRNQGETYYPPAKLDPDQYRTAWKYTAGNNLPMYYINWEEAMHFCRKLTEQERLAGNLPPGYRYSLPYDAQWEFAAKGGVYSKGFTHSGGNQIIIVGWVPKNATQQQTVGKKRANELGIYDMTGNVSEMTLDNIAKVIKYGQINVDPAGVTDGSDINTCGGSFKGSEGGFGYSNFQRDMLYTRNSRSATLGFRVVLCKERKTDPPPRKKPTKEEQILLDSCRNMNAPLIAKQIKAGVNVNCRSDAEFAMTPLLLACSGERENSDLVGFLLKNGAKPNYSDTSGKSPLYYAARNGWISTIEYLLKNGAKVNKADENGVTPLHEATRYHHRDAVLLLLRNGANINAQTKTQKTPDSYAKDKRIQKIYKQILK